MANHPASRGPRKKRGSGEPERCDVINNMEYKYRISTAIIYFLQMFLLFYFYNKTEDNNVLFDSAVESTCCVVIRSTWAILIIISISLYLIFPSALRWGSVNLAATFRNIGIFVGMISNALILWVLISLGKNISAALKVRADQQLVTTGPYRYARHPLYSCGILLFFSIGLISANWYLGVIGIAFQFFIMYARTPLEEKILIQHFGNEYELYVKTTGTFFPKIFSFKQ